MAAELVTPSSLSPANMETQNPNPPSQELEVGDTLQPELHLNPPPQFVNSLDQLRSLSTALTLFLRRYDELQTHMDFIRTSIDANSPQPLDSHPSLAIVPFVKTRSVEVASPNSPSQVEPTDAPINAPAPATKTQSPDTKVNQTGPTQKTLLPKSNESETLLPKSTVSESVQINTVEDSNKSILLSSGGKGIRKYILSNLSDANKVRKEVVAFLEVVPKPANVVLAGFGRFYMTGIRAYIDGSPLIKSRQAAVLLMECFMLMGYDHNEIDEGDKKEAASAAEAWKRRLMSEGGLGRTRMMEARGLLLLIGCYGIPGSFDNRDVSELIAASGAREISDALRKSKVLAARIPDVIEEMKKNKMEIEAVNAVYVFGLESRFPPRDILESFLRHSKETWTQSKKGEGAAVANRASRRHLADLKSVIKCLQSHKVDPAKLIPGWQIKQKMASLEKDIADTEKILAEQGTSSKRKADDLDASSIREKSQEVKRSRHTDLRRQSPRARSPYVDGGGYSGNSTIPRSLEGGFPGYLSSFPASTPRGSGDLLLPYDPYAVLQAAPRSDLPMRQAIYEDSLRYSRLAGAGDASSSFRESRSYMDAVARFSRSVVPSVEGFAGLPNPSSSSSMSGVSSRRSGSDLYQFADTIL